MILVVVCALSMLASTSSAATFALYSTPSYDSCNLQISGSGSGTFYVVAVDCVAPIRCSAGLGATAFRIDGLPLGWSAVVSPSPEGIPIGDVFGESASLGFVAIQHASQVLLYTVTITPPSAGAAAVLQVVAASPPPFGMDCPVRIGAADCPVFPDAACVDGGTLFVNTPGDCVIAVEPRAWGWVKRLYKDAR